MIAVSNASPLISLARIGSLDRLRLLFASVYISREVYDEVVIAGAALPGAMEVSKAGWITVLDVRNAIRLLEAQAKYRLGAGEVSAVQLGQELKADVVLMDERRGRLLAKEMGVAVVGCIGILEALYRSGHISDLRQSYASLLRVNARVHFRTLQGSLAGLGLPPL